MVEINRRDQVKRPFGPNTDSKLRSHSLQTSQIELYNNVNRKEQKIVNNSKARISTLDKDMLPSKLMYEPYITELTGQSNPHSRIST